jgi:SAM-dependent methyltransferase
VSAAAAWHDLECGSYVADLEAWERLAAEAGGPVLDLGCGTGRVALHLARGGHEVLGVDRDPELVAELVARAASEALPVEGVVADVRSLDLERRFPLALAPMQLAQLLSEGAQRHLLFERIAAHLEPGGAAALAIVDELPEPAAEARPLPDVLEREGWVLSSLPVSIDVSPGRIHMSRLRQSVSPAGELSEERSEIALARLNRAELEGEAAPHGLRPDRADRIDQSEDHVGSTVVVLRKEA